METKSYLEMLSLGFTIFVQKDHTIRRKKNWEQYAIATAKQMIFTARILFFFKKFFCPQEYKTATTTTTTTTIIITIELNRREEMTATFTTDSNDSDYMS